MGYGTAKIMLKLMLMLMLVLVLVLHPAVHARVLAEGAQVMARAAAVIIIIIMGVKGWCGGLSCGVLQMRAAPVGQVVLVGTTTAAVQVRATAEGVRAQRLGHRGQWCGGVS